MSGKPAARIDDKVKYARIVTGSRTVLIGTQGGVACSVCPSGTAVGNPVNPQLGAKVLSGASDLDFALPGAMPLVWQRQYSSYVNAEQGGYCGMLGYGWGLPMELRISMQASATLLHDSQGRTITFDALAPGESIYSASEDIWLLRSGMHAGGLSQELAAMTGAARFSAEAPHDTNVNTNANANAKQLPGQAPLWWQGRFAWIGRDMACSDLLVSASTGNGDTVWVFAPANWQQIEAARAARQAQQTAGKPLTTHTSEPEPDPNWVLLGKIDRLDRKQRYHWSQVLGQERITGIDDGVGRHYQLHYQQILPAQDAQHYSHADGHFFWQTDSGVRLTSIRLARDPAVTDQTEPITLVHYSYSAQGDLLEVQDRHGQVTRRFAWRNHLMVFHQERSGPEHHYAYDRYEPGGQAIAQRNQEGLDYQFAYQTLPEANGQPRRACVVTDSLGRIDRYIFQGEAGLARLVEHQRADGSTVQRSYNQFGHLTSVTDPLGRRVSMQVSPLGQLLSSQGPGGARSSQRFDDATGRLQSSTDAAGRTTHYAYDHYGRMTQVTLPDGSTEHYHYPAITDASGAQADLATRLNADKPHRITDAKGGDKHLTYTRTGQTASYTDCSGHSTRYAYNRWGQTLAVSNALAERVRYLYNAQDQLQAVQYPDGSTEHYQYDAQGQVVEVKAGHLQESGRQASESNTPVVPSTTAATVSMQYDLWGRLVQRSHAGASLAFAYDAAGRLTQLTNENGEHTSFAWDAMDRLTQEAGFDARVQSYQYDAAGQLTESSDGWAAEQGLASHTSRYEWTLNGQLAARHLPASDRTPAATHRYEWGKTGELLQASVWHQRAGPAAQGQGQTAQTAQDPAGAILQSQALIERDAAGRVIGEVQRLYKAQATSQRSHPFASPEIEFEHRISHKLDAMGNRLSSQLPGLGEVGYLLYGPGHVHGITWQGEALIDIERDVLHRETRRQLLTDIPHPAPGQSRKPLVRGLGWDTAGRLTTMQWSGLEQGASLPDMLDQLPGATSTHIYSGSNPTRPPQTVLGALTAKHYHYDSLGQMVGIQSPAGISRFAYDAAGRLTGADTPHAGAQRWQFDPAGNRLPITGPQSKPAPTEAITGELNETDRLRAQQRASAQANPITPEQLLRPDFNPLQASQDPASHQPLPRTQRWVGNRVAYYENSEDKSSQGAKTHYRYDSRGNRIQSLDETTGRQMDLYWDTGNQLVQVQVQESGKHHLQHYRYDAFGRRLAKYNHPANSAASHESGTDYFGWDGDRLVHTERFNATNNQDNNGAAQPEIIHTIYEPGSFTPLIQLRRATKAPPDLADQLLSNTQPGLVQDALRGVLSDIKAMNASMQHNIAIQAMPPDVQRFMFEQFQELEQTVTSQREEAAQSIEIRHYLCDHLGTPHALIREDTHVEWAVQLDAWGNVRVKHNPSGLYQPIRLPGQHADADTGLYYNRYRYYESRMGRYINQDPIRLAGGFNIYAYPINPISFYDSIGLQKVSIGRRNGGSQKASLLFDQTYPQVDLDIQTAKTISLPQYEIGGAANGKKPWQELSPYDYTQYCKKWSKSNLSCTAKDKEPGRDVKNASNYMPSDRPWKTSEIPSGYSCDSPAYFPELESAGNAATADVTDYADAAAKILRNRKGSRK